MFTRRSQSRESKPMANVEFSPRAGSSLGWEDGLKKREGSDRPFVLFGAEISHYFLCFCSLLGEMASLYKLYSSILIMICLNQFMLNKIFAYDGVAEAISVRTPFQSPLMEKPSTSPAQAWNVKTKWRHTRPNHGWSVMVRENIRPRLSISISVTNSNKR